MFKTKHGAIHSQYPLHYPLLYCHLYINIESTVGTFNEQPDSICGGNNIELEGDEAFAIMLLLRPK